MTGSATTCATLESLVVLSEDKLKLHFRRKPMTAAWTMLATPKRLDALPGTQDRHDYRPLIEQEHLPGEACNVTSEDFVPLRTAKDQCGVAKGPAGSHPGNARRHVPSHFVRV